MAITQALCTSFKLQMLNGEVDFSANTTKTYKMALYVSSATLGAATTQYTTTGEVASGGGYTTGGEVLTIVTPATSGTTAFVDFADETWTASTITARGALIYEEATGNPAVAVLDFGSDRASTGGNFTVQFPAATAANAIVRVL